MRVLKSVNVDAKLGFHGNTWLMRICMMPVDQVVKLGGMLLDAHPSLDASAVNSHKWSALHILAARGEDAVLPVARRLLEDHKAEANAKDGYGRSRLKKKNKNKKKNKKFH